MAIEIVDLPINSMVIFHSYVCLPEGNHPTCWLRKHGLWNSGSRARHGNRWLHIFVSCFLFAIWCVHSSVLTITGALISTPKDKPGILVFLAIRIFLPVLQSILRPWLRIRRQKSKSQRHAEGWIHTELTSGMLKKDNMYIYTQCIIICIYMYVCMYKLLALQYSRYQSEP